LANLESRILKAITKAAGSSFWLRFELTSSNILSTAADLTGAATGDLAVEQVLLSTNSTGLATGTNFEISQSGETYGEDKPIVETVTNLGASVSRSVIGGDTDATNVRILSVTGTPFILKAGVKLQYGCSGSSCTGAGKILIAIKFTRLTNNADIQAAV